MLVNFTVDHFRSFGAEQTLNMVATGLPDHPGHCVEIPGTDKSVLRIAAIYGANASGKSNLVKAIQFSQAFLLGRSSLAQLAANSFLFAKRRPPTSFEYRFLAGGQVFVYGFTVAQDAVLEEWLDAATESGREVNVFIRNKQDIVVGRLRAFRDQATPLRKALGALQLLGVRDDQLLFTRIIDLPDAHRGELLTRAVGWFADSLTVIEPNSEFGPRVNFLETDNRFRAFCGGFLKNVGTGIDALEVDKKVIDADKVPKPFLEELQAPDGHDSRVALGWPGMTFEVDARDPTKVVRRHLAARHRVGGADYPVPYHDQSDGTRRCLDLLPAVYPQTTTGRVFVVDEIDRSLHPLLSHALLHLFLDAASGQGRQMIVTTHETHLLDLDLLRRDEIWFMEKDDRQQSHLSSLADFKPRKDLRIDKGYLHGRFGGVPFIGDPARLRDLIPSPAEGGAG